MYACTLIGLLYSSYFWGWLADAYNKKTILMYSGVCMAFSSFFFGFSVNFYMAVIFRFLTGLTNGLYILWGFLSKVPRYFGMQGGGDKASKYGSLLNYYFHISQLENNKTISHLLRKAKHEFSRWWAPGKFRQIYLVKFWCHYWPFDKEIQIHLFSVTEVRTNWLPVDVDSYHYFYHDSDWTNCSDTSLFIWGGTQSRMAL